MLGTERGTGSGSDLYFDTPSDNASAFLYYLTSCGYYYTNFDYRIERENYHNFLLLYVREGRLSITTAGRTMVASGGQCAFFDCHQPHEYHAIGNCEFVWLHADGANIRDFYDRILQQRGGFVFSHARAQSICDQLFRIVYDYRNDQVPTELEMSRKIYSILIDLLEQGGSGDSSKSLNPAIAEAMDFIKSRYSGDISLNDVAAAVNMSPFYFSRLFKKECGYAPHEYVILTRLNRAKHLLKTTELPVKVIAKQVGYRNVTTFTNAFSERVGLPPSQFRNQYPIWCGPRNIQ